MHEYALSDSCHRLFFPDTARPVVQVQRGQTGIGRTGTDEDHLFPLILQIGQFPDQMFDAPVIELAVFIRNRTGPYFDDDAFFIGKISLLAVHFHHCPTL